MAMEFAITGRRVSRGSDDSWQPSGARRFFLGAPRAIPWRARRGERQIGELVRLALIAIFGAAGTLARYGLQGLVQIRIASTFPYGTLLVNLSGCFLLGLIGQFTLNRMVISP
jgi:hypothetical protein